MQGQSQWRRMGRQDPLALDPPHLQATRLHSLKVSLTWMTMHCSGRDIGLSLQCNEALERAPMDGSGSCAGMFTVWAHSSISWAPGPKA